MRETVKPIIAEQIPQYKIDSVEFEALTLGSLPPTFQGSNCSICLTHTSMMSLLLFFSLLIYSVHVERGMSQRNVRNILKREIVEN